MKVFFTLGFLFIFHICCVLSYEGIHDEEIYSDVGTPLMLHSSNIILRDSNVGRGQHGNDSCWSFSKIIKILFCVKDDESNSKLKRDHKNFFPILPTEVIQHIGDFLDPLSIITLSRTCKEAQMIFSNNYWAYKCQVEKLPPWGRDISPEKVYVANFWYKTQLPVMLKKAASIGHPESQKILKSMQPNDRTNKLQPSKFYSEPSSWDHFSRKFSGGGYYH